MAADEASSGNHSLMLLGCNSNVPLWQEVAEKLEVALVDATIGHFADGETQVVIRQSVRGGDCFVLQSTCPPFTNHHVMELVMTIDALRRASAHRITPVIPYYGYARSDKKLRPREPIGARVVANLLEQAGADRVLMMELHSASIPGFFNIPVDHLPAMDLLADQIREDGWADPNDCTVVSPDVGGVERASYVAKRLNLPMAIIAKRRDKPNEVRDDAEVIGDVAGRRTIEVDDIIDTAGSVCKGAERLRDKGAKGIRVYAAHGLFSRDAVSRIADSQIELVVVTNTVPPVSAQVEACQRIRWISVADILAKAISHNHSGQSISELFGRSPS